MSTKPTRRDFLKQSAVAGSAALAATMSVPHVYAASAGDKIRMAVIGCGGRGTSWHIPQSMQERLVAIVDPDPRKYDPALRQAASQAGQLNVKFDPSTVKKFDDYRKLFDTMANEIDAVGIATPNHHHAPAALMAMKLGKHVYVEKPMAYDIHEARLMAEYAKKYKVTSQMGNQGHSGEGYRMLCEYFDAGAIGGVREVYHFTDRANGGSGPRPPTIPAPAGMNWDNWIGPAPYRDFHKDLTPHEWHGWFDFGNGSLGNMACHIMDGAFWALKLGSPTSVVLEDGKGGTDERYTYTSRIRWDFPAREGLPPVKVYWNDGFRDGTDLQGSITVPARGANRNRPIFVDAIEKIFTQAAKRPIEYGKSDGGSIYIGDKGMMYSGCYGDPSRIIPEEMHQAFPAPAKTLPRVKGTHYTNFFEACRTGKPAVSDFSYASRFTEVILLGCLAVRAGVGRKLLWDGEKFTNAPDMNKYLQREYRKGWEV